LACQAVQESTRGQTDDDKQRRGVSAIGRSSLLAPFQVRSFRFQYPADLLTSWGTEMENLILGWYILVETGSVLLLTVFGSLQYFGTLIAPMFGMLGDRVGHRLVLCSMRACYATLASLLMVLAFTGALRPLYVFLIAATAGLIRSSDLAMRNALVADTMPVDRFVSAMGAARTTADSARTMAPLVGAGLFAALGMGFAYLVIAGFYTAGFMLTLGVGGKRYRSTPIGGPATATLRPSFLRDMREGLAYLWDTPASLAAMWLAFLVNMTAFPFTSGLLPYVARDVYHIDQTGLGWLISSFAFGSLLGSIVVSISSRVVRPARMMIVFAMAWYAMLLVFAHMQTPLAGSLALLLGGFAQNLSLVPMAVMLLHGAAEFRGRVMGMRMMAIYGLPIGLMAGGALIDRIGFVPMATLYCGIGISLTLLIALYWRDALWPLHATANAR
jgi:predicted MFS family arabinose efflux permease